MKTLFLDRFSFVDYLFLSAGSIFLSHGEILEAGIIVCVGLAITLTVGRKYNATSA